MTGAPHARRNGAPRLEVHKMRNGFARRLTALAAALLALALLLPSCGTAHPTAPPEAPSPAESPAPQDAAFPPEDASPSAPDEATASDAPPSPSAPDKAQTTGGATSPAAAPGVDGSAGEGTADKENSSGAGIASGKAGAVSASGGKGGDTVTKTLKLDAPSTAGALRVDGAHLVGSDGAAVQLRGISTHGIAWYPDYINSEAFHEFRYEWGANVVRLAMYTTGGGGYCTGGDKAAQKQLIRDGVKYATEQDMYVIVGEQDPNTYVDEAKDFFAEMSAEFAGSENVLYEICNEPNGGTSWQDIKRYAAEVIPVIRENAPDAVIIVGTPNWSQFVDEAAADPITDYDNLVYTLHFYAATHKSDLRERAQKAIDAGLPLFVSEFGICDASGNGALDYEQASLWLDLLDRYGISFVDWNLSNKDESSAIISPSCNKTSGFADGDLSESGKWLKKTLMEHAGTSGVSAPPSGGGTPASPAPSAATSPAAPPADATASTAPAGGSTVLSGDGLEVTAALSNSWESDGKTFRQYVLTVKNVSGSACSSWTVSLEFDAPIELSDGWNADYAAEGGTLRVSSKDYNGALDAGASATDVGFIVSGGALAQ